jgi:hypothetical protein
MIMAMLTKIGYGQVEPNHLSAQRTGQIYAQTPVNEAITELENGVFLKLNTSDNTLGVNGSGEWMLVYNEVKLYDNQRQGYKDFVVKADETVGGKIYPRMFKTNVGDIFTTNMIEAGLELGDKVTPTAGVDDKVGILKPVASGADPDMVFEVIKLTTMPDGQAGVKVVRTK